MSNSLSRCVALIAAVGLFAACTSAEVVSKKDPDYAGTVERLHLQTAISSDLEGLAQRASEKIRLSLVSYGIGTTVQHRAYTPDSKEESEGGPRLEKEKALVVPYEKARSVDASHVLLIEEKSQSESTTYAPPTGPTGGMASTTHQSYVFEASLYDVNLQKRIWRADVTAKGTKTTSQSMEGEVMADKMVERLAEDRLLPPMQNDNVSGTYR
ncbi:hypothetical protein CRI94_04050 [Longibacter salinarum]|uniref:Penicillin-binding protein activator LpoB n=1 Tax=Longibacter salinarum TaxID=1850348 RepID=A0A2A8D023_9BACT|nr:hypothetical protein [Longibacter salinarum]PEN14220.1 hypothetical protein CRI94_04050 [Longibacter salinarum]